MIMDDQTRQFLADAARIRLTPDEKAHIRGDLEQFAAGDIPQLERDPAVKAFLMEAAAISLTMDETASVRMDLEQFVAEQAVRSHVDARHAIGMNERSAVLGDPDEISLSERERIEVRRGLLSYMESKRMEHAEPQPEERITLREYLHDFWLVVVPRTAVLACAFLIVSTGVAFAAEGSMPGDWLYALKVDVFEHVRGRFIFTPEEKAQWESSRAMRRLEEAEWMAAKEGLTEEMWMHLQDDFMQHVVEAERHIEAVANAGDRSAADHLSADLDAYLRAHHTVLQAIGLERRGNPGIEEVLEHVRDTQEDISRKRVERFTEESPDDAEEYDRLTAESGIRSAMDELTRVRRSNDLPIGSRAAAKLRDAEEMLVEANAQFGAGLYKKAEAVAREAVKAAAEAKLMRRLEIEHPVPAVGQDALDRQPNDRSASSSDGERSSSSAKSSADPASSSSSSDADGERSSSSVSSAADESSSSSEHPEQEPGTEKEDDPGAIEVEVPGVNVQIDLKGLLD